MPGVFGAVNEFSTDTGWLHAPVLDYANYGVVLFAAMLLAGWWVSRSDSTRTVAAAAWGGAATLLAVALNQPIVHAVHEARPYTVHPQILVLAHRSADYSFPSDHAVMAGAVAAGLWLVDRRLGVVASVAAVLMAFSRVYIAAHYPHDVVAGLLLGATVVLLGWLVLRPLLTLLVEVISRTPLRPLVRAAPRPAGPQP